MAKSKKTSAAIAKVASKILRNKSSSHASKRVSGSALTQRESKGKK